MNQAEWSFHADDERQTECLGSVIAGVLGPGSVVTLLGELGTGKTRLVRAIAAELEVDPETVASPTFVLIREYSGRLPVFHFDAYRLADTDEFLEIGADEFLYGSGVCLIEWADRVSAVLPADVLEIRITATGTCSRMFGLCGSGARSRQLLEAIKQTLSTRG